VLRVVLGLLHEKQFCRAPLVYFSPFSTMLFSGFPALIGLAIHSQVVHGFISCNEVISRFQELTASTRLFYTNDPPQPRRPVRRALTIPVLGPIPGGPPLVVGEDYVLEQPTPMQWTILEEAIHSHRKYLKEEHSEATTNDRFQVVCVDAAPLVAFLDERTSVNAIPGDKKNSKYATIAAVVGISSMAVNAKGIIDSSSTSSFMESIMLVFQPDKNIIRPTESKIRLVGIGRAALSDFYSQLPSIYYEDQGGREGNIALQQQTQQDTNLHNDDEDARIPIIMAQFRLLTDSGKRSSAFVDQFGRSGNSSPAHALAEMSDLAARITSLHEDRKHLVRGLRAAKARLAVASQLDILEDHDGLGMLSSGFQLTNNPQSHAIATLLSEFPDEQSLSSLARDSHARLLEMENYGMGISSSYFSAIPSLTSALAEKLQPYFSPEKQDTEEHYYEVFSFMGLLSLNKFVAVADVDWALKCTNTIERMQWVYESMWSHKKLLREASVEVSQELRDCGEECTDLW
jgi:hypothetical protein